MTKFEKGKKNFVDTKAKAVKGYKRFSTFAHASALAVLVGYAGQNVLNEIRSGDRDAATIILTVSTVLVGLTALILYVKFFTEDN